MMYCVLFYAEMLYIFLSKFKTFQRRSELDLKTIRNHKLSNLWARIFRQMRFWKKPQQKKKMSSTKIWFIRESNEVLHSFQVTVTVRKFMNIYESF